MRRSLARLPSAGSWAVVVGLSVAGLVAGCAGGGQRPEPLPTDEVWVATSASVRLTDGYTASLQVARDRTLKPGSRCWRVIESDDDGTVAAMSACGAPDGTSAGRAFGAVVVVSSCAAPSTVALYGTSGRLEITDVFDGIFLVPPGALAADAREVTYSCVGASGGEGEPVTLAMPG